MLKYGDDLYNRLLQFEFQSLAPFFSSCITVTPMNNNAISYCIESLRSET